MRVEFTELARMDLDDIYDYVATTLDNPIAANRLIDRLTSCAKSLATFPYLGRALNETLIRKRDYRFLVCQGYLLFYRVAVDHVEVIRVLNGRTDYLRKLGLAPTDSEGSSN